MNKNHLLQALSAIKSGHYVRSCGICQSIRGVPGAVKWLERVSVKWGGFSGDKEYPVPHPEYTPEAAYAYCRRGNAMWDASTEYGRNRLEFLDFLIEEATKLEGTFYES